MLQGEIQNGIHRLLLRVHYEDTDFSGVVYHANYLKFCERARSDWIRLGGFDQNAMAGAGTGVFFMVRRMICEFLRPSRFDDILTVETRPGKISGARFGILQKVSRGQEVLFTADVTAVLVDARGKPQRIPKDLSQRFAGQS